MTKKLSTPPTTPGTKASYASVKAKAAKPLAGMHGAQTEDWIGQPGSAERLARLQLPSAVRVSHNPLKLSGPVPIDAMSLAQAFARLAGAKSPAPAASDTVPKAPPPKDAGMSTVRTAADLSQLVRSRRKSRNMTQQAFADLAGVGRRFLSELENGKPTLEFDKVLLVLTASGIDLLARPRQ